jgi:hypothetical protein
MISKRIGAGKGATVAVRSTVQYPGVHGPVSVSLGDSCMMNPEPESHGVIGPPTINRKICAGELVSVVPVARSSELL